MTRPRRAPPLDRAARRRSIITAVTPLLVARGAGVTTHELAEAAGVAEGTLFTVFEDKRSLLLATIEERLDPGPLRAGLARLAELPGLERKLLAVAGEVVPRLDEVHGLAVALHAVAGRGRPRSFGGPTYMRDWLAEVAAAVRDLLEPHAAELRVSPALFARLFTTQLFASRLPHAAPEDWPTPEELVTFCLRGALAPERER